jgi:hypothetical protein
MIKRTIAYTDYDGNERTEDFYFHLNKAELTEMELSNKGGFTKLIQKIIAEQDSKNMCEIFKDVILRAYGQKSLDGRRFMKSQELRDEFSQTEAYSELFTELASNADAAAAFINGIIPQQKS